MQSTCTQICEALTDFKCGAVTGWDLCNKSVHEISFIQDIPWKTLRWLWNMLEEDSAQDSMGVSNRGTVTLLKSTCMLLNAASKERTKSLYKGGGCYKSDPVWLMTENLSRTWRVSPLKTSFLFLISLDPWTFWLFLHLQESTRHCQHGLRRLHSAVTEVKDLFGFCFSKNQTDL